MSLEVTHFELASSPQYIMNNITTSTTTSCSSSPIAPAFILRPVSPAAAVSPVSDRELSNDDEGIPRGVEVADPIGKFMIMELPECIHNPHIPYAYQDFPIFTVNPYTLLPIPPIPLSNIENYRVPHTHNSVYHITVSTDSPPVLLDSAGLDDTKSFYFYLQQMLLLRAYQVYSGPLDRHQMMLIANLAITNYKNRGMINLPALRNDMINPRPNRLFSHSVRALYHHPVSKWLATLERIKYKKDTLRWFYVHSSQALPLMIKEYVPKGMLPEALFPLNDRGVHQVATYWDQGATPADYIRPWVMTKKTSAGSGFHPILTDAHHYVRQNIVDPPNTAGQVLRPGDSTPYAIALPLLRQSIGHSHLPPPENSPIAP